MSNRVQKSGDCAYIFFVGNKTHKLSSGGVFDKTEGFVQQMKALNNFVVNDDTGLSVAWLVGERTISSLD